MKRRDFLKSSMLTVAGLTGPGFLSKSAQAAIGKGKILVVIQLSGGNDALNTLVPYTNGAYYAARPSIAIEKRDVLTLSSDVGLHPSLKALMPLWDNGQLGLVQGVGYPNANRSHFESMAIWHTADPSAREHDGWIGKIAEKYGDPFCATNFGGTTPLALRGADIILPSIANIDSFQLKLAPETKSAMDVMLGSSLPGRAETIRNATRQMFSNIESVQKGVSKYKSGVQYPDSNLAKSLRDVARLISADVGPRVFYTSQGGYDTHAAQPEDHPELLDTLASSIMAFRADLEKQGRLQDVMIIGFSEFGRRLAENASSGTDHGKAGLMFTIGDGVKGGLYGAQPDLEKLNDGDPVMTTDFRQVYATALDGWLNVPSRDILGANFKNIAFLK
ncbi:MAG: hypothetical protein RLZZ156_2853 [Deinococcota bacterium]|jgi:uncharacterized protein (DUF1501 family)